MRRNSVRHFVHMVIDILPLLIIPIFALNILHKETEPISIEVQEKIYYETNEVHTSSDIVEGNAYLIDLSNGFTTSGNITFPVAKAELLEGTFVDSFTAPSLAEVPYVRFYTNNRIALVQDKVSTTDDLFPTYTLAKVVVIAGNEYTNLGNLVSYFQPYYDYYEEVTTTYNSTDIGSQFVYALYKPVHDYFNFNNLFNMGAIYNWIELNLFSGTAPLPIFIIWNVIVYEFFVDLIFLLYAVFMFVIDFATNTLDSFMYKSRRGI